MKCLLTRNDCRFVDYPAETLAMVYQEQNAALYGPIALRTWHNDIDDIDLHQATARLSVQTEYDVDNWFI